MHIFWRDLLSLCRSEPLDFQSPTTKTGNQPIAGLGEFHAPNCVHRYGHAFAHRHVVFGRANRADQPFTLSLSI
ncbi:hypothetical protein EMIT053CA3_130008 [Pseudomonas donghuensis]